MKNNSGLSPEQILESYWGYRSFRQLQPEIISSVLAGNDTLGLLPTGGGKSITFQVPALMLPGLTVVVTPLISLMKDQVDNLHARDIPAAALHSGLTRREQTLVLDKTYLGRIKLLYLSPEKLQSKNFLNQLSQFNISLIVVDEAHCISQWGYDFRPSYLKIAALRKLHPAVPVLALTASATPEVCTDIMQRLEFRKPLIFSRSFSRSNISYIVRKTELKEEMCLKILKATRGSAIVYVRSRKRTRAIAELLVKNGITADYYHAGLSAQEKNDRQNLWTSNKIRVMVATNAFGMGIDKPDVRCVIHIDSPPSLEEYYQEAGRAGRDGLPAFAVLIAAKTDKANLTRHLNEAFPEKDYIKRIYELAFNFMDIAVGAGYGMVCEFNFNLFCQRFNLKPVPARNALLLLTRAGYLEYVDELSQQSRITILLTKNELYTLRLDDTTDNVFQTILRMYTGLFADYVIINEGYIARQLHITEQQVYQSLLTLAREHAVHYVPRKTTPYIYITTSRELPKHVILTRDIYENMRQRMATRIDAMKSFIFNDNDCRVRTMLTYFGEKNPQPCGNCDICRDARKQTPPPINITEQTMRLIRQGHTDINEIARNLSVDPDKIIDITRRLADEGLLSISPSLKITLL